MLQVPEHVLRVGGALPDRSGASAKRAASRRIGPVGTRGQIRTVQFGTGRCCVSGRTRVLWRGWAPNAAGVGFGHFDRGRPGASGGRAAAGEVRGELQKGGRADENVFG